MTTSPVRIAKYQARKFLSRYHFLSPARSLTKEHILSILFPRLGCIQFDTINVVGRNADLVLQSRIEGYSPDILDKLLYEERTLLDGWDKLASIYPTTDWPYFERRRNYIRKRLQKNAPEVSKHKPRILQAIEEHGEMSSIHFKENAKTDWAWGPTSISRAALEALYSEGALGIHHRVNTRRHFDLIERLVPQHILEQSDPNPDLQDYLDWHILRRIGGVGIASSKSGEHWLGIHEGRLAKNRNEVLKRLSKQGRIIHLEIEEINNSSYFIQKESLPLLEVVLQSDDPTPSTAAFIAPLDNLIWNRKLVNELFDFSYVWEVYKPKNKREYGYYVLPVLYQDNFIARVDMKFHRKLNKLELINWWWEEGVSQTAEMHIAIQTCFADFLSYLGAKSFTLNQETIPKQFITDCLSGLV
ncbi:winged helix DNA-binding domain-containing protein [bacterium]|nr:winged helix DNA-binding domain-containing protein [bacterium]